MATSTLLSLSFRTLLTSSAGQPTTSQTFLTLALNSDSGVFAGVVFVICFGVGSFLLLEELVCLFAMLVDKSIRGGMGVCYLVGGSCRKEPTPSFSPYFRAP